jgi:hypothetical protein
MQPSPRFEAPSTAHNHQTLEHLRNLDEEVKEGELVVLLPTEIMVYQLVDV